MKGWILKNERLIITLTFIIPIIIVAIISISHVTQWYGITNPLSWAIYLSIGIEIAAMSALSALTVKMGKSVYFPFIIVTLIQFIGNIFFSYSYIDITTSDFKNWIELVSPLLSLIGIDPTDTVAHKRFLSLFSGGMMPLISLTFLHMLIKFNNKEEKKEDLSDNKEDKILLIEKDNLLQDDKLLNSEGELSDKNNDVIPDVLNDDNMSNEEELIKEEKVLPEEKKEVTETNLESINNPEITNSTSFVRKIKHKVDNPNIQWKS